jgi:hypothetical protein
VISFCSDRTAASLHSLQRLSASGDGRHQKGRDESTEATEPEVFALDCARRGEQPVHWRVARLPVIP